MCGIAGYMGAKKIGEERLDAALRLMERRGPDFRKAVTFEAGNLRVDLLHSRLSIIDLDPHSNQPLTRGDVTLAFNGEIYNYKELRKELEAKGVRFTTQSDTEVLLEAYRTFGEKCVERFEGMWSFAIYDAGTKKLLLSRDRFGEKPLYFFREADGIYFGSEIKFIRALAARRFPVNEAQISRFLVNGYKSLYKTGDTFFWGVEELPAATTLTVDAGLKGVSRTFWSLAADVDEGMPFENAVEGFRERLLESMRIRLRADVPIAFCLSGGVDSAALASIAVKRFDYKIRSYSIVDRDDRYNEEANIRATIEDLACAHTLIPVPKDRFFERLSALTEYHDAPVYTISYYVHAFLSEAMSKDGYRVAVSGTGADELVTGYYDHFNQHLYEMKDEKDFESYLSGWRTHVQPLVRNRYLRNPRLYFDDPGFRAHMYLDSDVFRGYLTKEFREEFEERRYSKSLLRNRMLNELFHEAIPVILHEDDLNSMRYSVENRSPYLDSRLAEFAYKIPPRHLIGDGYGKVVLREAMKGLLNETVRLDRRKVGFNASVASLVDLGDKKNVDAILGDSPIFEYVDAAKIRAGLRGGTLDDGFNKFIFSFLSAKAFLETQA